MRSRSESYPYPFLSRHLIEKGYSVYPNEMVCGSIDCPHERNRFVDVVARKNKELYAFEYKSSGDHIMRAIPQLENYRLSFDYIVLVAEIPRTEISMSLSRGQNIKEFVRLGAGIWTVEFSILITDRTGFLEREKIDPKFTVLREPDLQSPHPRNRRYVELKFWKYGSGLRILRKEPDRNQKYITGYLEEAHR